MAEASSHVAHHFDDAEQQYDAALLGMWTFLATEVLFFGGMLTCYAIYRFSYPTAFAEGSLHLDWIMGTVNTGVLLLSSFTMALAVHAAQTGRRQAIVGFLLATMVLGGVFLGVKVIEYSEKFEHHLVPGHGFVLEHAYHEGVEPRHVELFYSFYFTMTGFHALHMIIGIVAVAILAYNGWRGRYSPKYHTPVELTGLYWHFVDIVWVFLFPLLYLIEVPR